MSNLTVWDMLKYTFKALNYKLQQHRLNTGATVVLKTLTGPVKGAKRLTVWGKSYYSFEGIPFAEPPVGDLRFRAPVPVKPWLDILDCTGPAAVPMQANMFFQKHKGSEDCLYLNIFTNEIAVPYSKRPVMVWIFGGGFQIGEATRDMYSPDYFMSRDVVLVTIAYRLGPFGFLSLDDPAVQVPGNAGLKDQIMALKWIQDNISCFGGDPNNVTLFGESAGGSSTHLCMLSDAAQGLIHKAIIMSGSVLCPWTLSPPNQWAFRLAIALGYKGEEKSHKIYKFLQTIPAATIQEAVPSVVRKEEKHNRILMAFGPVVEPYRSVGSILTEDPKDMLSKTWSNNDVPLLIGGTSFEGLLFYPEVMRRKATLDEVGNCENLLPLDLQVERKSKSSLEMAGKLKTTYFGNEDCNLKNVMKFLELESYREFWHPIYRTCRSRIKNAKASTYLYRFDYDSPGANAMRNFFCGPEIRGTCHGDDLCYLFRFLLLNKLNENSPEFHISQTMIDIWTSFATNGDPNCPSLKQVKFEPLAQEDDMKCLNISNKIEYIPLPELEKMHVWNSFYTKGKL
ncbi:esterase B1-like isoform 1-T1 [Glossina fuscipes fuscipes]